MATKTVKYRLKGGFLPGTACTYLAINKRQVVVNRTSKVVKVEKGDNIPVASQKLLKQVHEAGHTWLVEEYEE